MITLFFRKETEGFNSIEQVFNELIPFYENVFIRKMPKKQISLKNILINIHFSRKNTTDVNHIVGDINYIIFGLNKRNTILTIHDIESLTHGNFIKKHLLNLFWLWLPVRMTNYITVISETTKLKLANVTKINSQKIRIIHNPVSSRLKYVSKKFNSDNPVILHIGTKTNKNLERVIKALRNIPCYLFILGRLSEEQKRLLIGHSINYKSFFQLQFKQVIELYEQCDFLIFPSLYEGFGMPIIEAQAVGRPVMTSNISAMPEIAGDAAFFVDPYDITEIRNGVLSIISDAALREDLIRKGLENVKRFQAENIAKQYMELYNEILEQ